MKRSGPLSASGNPFADRARALKAQRLSLILWEAGFRRAWQVRAMGPEARTAALEVLARGLAGPEAGRLGPGGRAPAAGASEATWRGVASIVGYLGGGSGGRRPMSVVQSRSDLGSS